MWRSTIQTWSLKAVFDRCCFHCWISCFFVVWLSGLPHVQAGAVLTVLAVAAAGFSMVEETEVDVTKILRSAVLSLMVFAPGLLAQQAENASFKTWQVNDSIYMLEPLNTNGNVGVFTGADGILLVDSHFPNTTADLVSAVRQFSDEEFRFLVNTHIHPDHIGGNSNLAGFGITIIAHDLVREQFFDRVRIPRRGGTFFPQPAEDARPMLTYSEALSFHMNGEEVRVFLSPPAHTGGDSFVHFRGSDVLHLGDVFRTNMYPIIDHYNGGSFLGMIDAMALAISIAGPDTVVIPGHGVGLSDRAGMIEVRDTLIDMRDRVQRMIDQGMELDAVMAAEPMRDLDPRWGQVAGWTAVDLVPIIYQELAAQGAR